MENGKGFYGPLFISHYLRPSLEELSGWVDRKPWSYIEMSEETYKDYDSRLEHFGKKCDNPCENLEFQGIKIIIRK